MSDELQINTRACAIHILILSSQMYIVIFFSSFFHSKVNPKGGLIAVGFEDGVVRIIEVYDPKGLPALAGHTNIENAEINLKQAFKPHAAAVTALAYERNGDVLATGVCITSSGYFLLSHKCGDYLKR